MGYAGSGGRDADARRRRALSLAAAATVHLLLLLMLLRLAPPVGPRRVEPPTTVVMLPEEKPKPKPVRFTHEASGRRATGGQPKDRTRPPAPKPTPDASAKPWVLNPDLAQFTLSASATKVAAAAPPAAAAQAGSGRGEEQGEEDSAGTGPGGVRLYWAKWYREPTDAELDTYLPRTGTPDGAWADIACRTVARWHVEDCVELGEAPPGSGLSRAMRQASFQFLVRPPRVNGDYLVGAWVRIHTSFSEILRRSR